MGVDNEGNIRCRAHDVSSMEVTESPWLTIRPNDPHRLPKAAGRHDGASIFSCLFSISGQISLGMTQGLLDDEEVPGVNKANNFCGAASDQVEHHNFIQDVGESSADEFDGTSITAVVT